MDLVLKLADDPEIGIGSYAQSVRVGPGIRMSRSPALYRPKRRLRLPEQMDSLESLDEHPNCENIWRSNCASLAPLEEKVLEGKSFQNWEPRSNTLHCSSPNIQTAKNCEGSSGACHQRGCQGPQEHAETGSDDPGRDAEGSKPEEVQISFSPFFTSRSDKVQTTTRDSR